MCVLRVSGKTFDAERYLAASGLTAVKLFHAGEPRARMQPDGKRHDVSAAFAWTSQSICGSTKEPPMAQFEYFPPELVTKAGAVGLGLELSIYPRDLEERVLSRRKAKQDVD
jgi:hypothetical protein